MNDLRRNPQALRRYLLGDTWNRPAAGDAYLNYGLLGRVKEKVEEMTEIAGLTYQGGSVLRTDPLSKVGHPDPPERVMDLAVALVEWKGKGIGQATPIATRSLIAYLHRNRIEDSTYILGGKKVGKGLLHQTRSAVKDLLRPDVPPSKDVDRCVDLAAFLSSWVSGCDHDFHQPDPAIEAFTCTRCGSEYGIRDELLPLLVPPEEEAS